MKVDYLITNGEKKFFSNYCKKQVPGTQNKTNNIKIDSENKSIFSYKQRTRHKVVIFSMIKLKINISNKTTFPRHCNNTVPICKNRLPHATTEFPLLLFICLCIT